MGKDLRKCPHCKGSGWDPKGGECYVCDGTGVIASGDDAPATIQDADDFFSDYYQRKTAQDF